MPEGEAEDGEGLGRPVGADQHAVPWLGAVLRPDHHHRARGATGDLLAHRPEDDAQYVASTTRPDHDQSRVRGDVEQGLTWVDRAHGLVYDELRVPGDDSGGCSAQHRSTRRLEIGEDLHRVRAAEAAPRRTDRERAADAVHQQEVPFLESSLVGGPVESPVGELGGVDADDDAAGGQTRCLHGPSSGDGRAGQAVLGLGGHAARPGDGPVDLA